MTKTVFENVEPIVENLPRIKQMVRKIGPLAVGDVDSIQTVDAELSSWVNNGWKLTFIERISTEPDGHVILYVLTKD